MSSPRNAANAAQNSAVLEALARGGYVVLGVVHIVIGLIAIASVTSAGGGEADQGGAMAQIQKSPLGTALLWVIAVGLFALTIWQIAEAFLERDHDAKKKWAHRVKFIGTAVAYIAISITAVVYAFGGQSDSSQSTQSLSAQLLAAPAGIAALVALGVVVAGIGVAFIVRGFARAFTTHLSLPGGTASRGIVVFGVVGYVAKGIAVAITGVLFVVAAVTRDPEAAGGLDGALDSLASLPYGPVILWLVGAGFVVYGLFCFAWARYARM